MIVLVLPSDNFAEIAWAYGMKKEIKQRMYQACPNNGALATANRISFVLYLD